MRNRFATIGRKLHRLIIPRMNTRDYMCDPYKVMEVLDKIGIPDGKALKCYLADRNHYFGDNSFLYVNDIDVHDGEEKYSFLKQTWKNITIEPSEMGIWQVYLLMTAIHVMPYFWHGGYSKRIFIFSPNDLKKITALKKQDLSHINEIDLQPEVSFNELLDNEYMGMVSCTYWTPWGGLVRETVTIIMKENQIADYGPAIDKVLFRYDCGICY